MRVWVLLCLAAGVAEAQDVTTTVTPEAAVAPPVTDPGAAALPGGLHVPSAELLAPGAITFEGLSGFGYRKGLLGPDHRFGRAIGDLAASYAITTNLALALEFDGRYDRHYGLAPTGDDGYVGDPHLYLRYVTGKFGVQAGVWVPGKDAPSVAASATSVDVQLFGTLAAGPGKLSIAAGFRIDNSASSVDMPDNLSLQDRVSLGVSEFNEIVGGLRYSIGGAKTFASAEASTMVFVGSGAPGPIIRGTAIVGMRLSSSLSALAYVEVAKVPGVLETQVMNNVIPLIPYEPIVTGGIGLEARFGGPKPKSAGSYVEKDCAKHTPPDCPGVKVPITADISGTVVDDQGAPVVGAKVTLTLKDSTVAPTTTDDKGNFTFAGVPIGTKTDGKPTIDETAGAIAVEVDGKKPGSATVTLAEGKVEVAKISLESNLPPGELRGIVTLLSTGGPLANAKVTLEPSGKTATTAADGTFKIELPPGQYKMTVTATGMAKQELDVTIDTNGVTTKNINMRK